MMGAWGFVFLAYGIVWGTILIYWLTLKRRLERAEAGRPAAVHGEVEAGSVRRSNHLRQRGES